jgi:hypothetical protein
VTQFIRILRLAPPFFRGIPFNHRTNTGPRIRQAPARGSDGSRFRRLEDRIIFYVILEGLRLLGEERGKQEKTLRAVTVYRVDSVRKIKDPVGVVLERRKTERTNNYNDLLRLARRLFAVDTADAVHIVIDVRQARQA